MENIRRVKNNEVPLNLGEIERLAGEIAKIRGLKGGLKPTLKQGLKGQVKPQ